MLRAMLSVQLESFGSIMLNVGQDWVGYWNLHGLIIINYITFRLKTI